MTVKLRVIRWRCGNAECERQTFADPLPEIASPHARRTCRAAEIVQLLGHVVGGLPGERLMKRLGMPVSDDTILRQLKRCATARGATTTVRIAGIDDWSWRKGCTYGTIVVDLERREVVDVLPDRSAPGTAEWLSRHPEVEIISRDRCGLYAQGAREGAPQARQVADRFHLLQNLRETIETQLSRADRPTGRALLPESKDENVVTIAYGPGADAGSRSIDTLPSRRIVARGKPSLIKSVLYATPETLSATSPEKPGSVRAASENG